MGSEMCIRDSFKTLGVGSSRAGSRVTGKKDPQQEAQLAAKARASSALITAMGIKIGQATREGGKRKRAEGTASHSYGLEVTASIQKFLDLPNEIMAEHWYTARYKEPPPHLDEYKLQPGDGLDRLHHVYRWSTRSSAKSFTKHQEDIVARIVEREKNLPAHQVHSTQGAQAPPHDTLTYQGAG